jgi:hypothetical protein
MLRTGPSISSPSSVLVAKGTIVPIPGATVTDSFAANNPGSMALNVSCTTGTLTMKDQNGNPVSGSGSNSLQFSGTLSQVNATLATLTYTAGDSTGSDTVAINVWNQIAENTTQDTFVTIAR